MENSNSFSQNNYKNRIKSEILILEKSKKQNRILALGYFILLFIFPFAYFTPFVLIPMFFCFTGCIAFLVRSYDDQANIDTFRKNF